MQDRIALVPEEIRRRHGMELAMSRASVRACVRKRHGRRRRSASIVGLSIRSSVRAGPLNVDDARRGIPALAQVSHDRDFALGDRTPAIAAKDERFVDREYIRVLAAREERPGQRASR